MGIFDQSTSHIRFFQIRETNSKSTNKKNRAPPGLDRQSITDHFFSKKISEIALFYFELSSIKFPSGHFAINQYKVSRPHSNLAFQ